MDEKIRVGLIGLGTAGQRHAAAIRKSGQGELVAAADPASVAAQTASELGVRCWSNYETMLEQAPLDAVIICLPHALLAPAALTAARYRKHILLEKPMSTRVADARAVVEACHAAKVKLMVNLVHRFRDEAQQARAALHARAIGKPVLFVDLMASGRGALPNWVWQYEMSGGGMMMYNGIHSIDRLAWLAGNPIHQVSAAMGTFSYPVPVEDNLVATVSFGDGALGALVQHKSDAGATLGGWQTLVYGTRGALKLTTGSGLEIVSESERANVQTGEGDRFLGAFQEFTSAIRENREPSPSGQDGMRALEVVLALYESARTGCAQPIGAAESP